MDGNEGVLTLARAHLHSTSDKYFLSTTGFILVVALFTTLIIHVYIGVAVIISYAVGCIGMQCVLRHVDYRIPNVLSKYQIKTESSKLPSSPKVCTVCGNIECRRHRSDSNALLAKPWMDLKVPQEVDEALEEILNLVLEKYIYSWYSSLSNDDSFVQEIRVSLQFLFSSLLRRALQVDLVHLITVKIGKALIQHVDCFLHAKQVAQSSDQIEKFVLQYLRHNLHPAMESREMELSYLRQLTENILPFIVQRKYLQCRSACSLVREIFCGSIFLPVMDILADPDTVNTLLLLFFDKTPMVSYPDSNKPSVELLTHFVNSHVSPNPSVLHTDLQTVLHDQRLLYMFMHFLKEEAAVNVLQFFLSVDDFNNKILNPELTKDELEELHFRAQEMYNTYFAPNAVDKINFDDAIVHEIKEIIDGTPENVTKLRTTTPLFRAYDHAYWLLDKIYCPMFLQSDKYFSLLCGERWSSTVGRNSAKGNKRISSPSTMSKLGNKIRGVFVTNIDEGQVFEEEAGTDLAEAIFSDAAVQPETFGEGDVYRMDNDPRLKKLSAWRVFIPRVLTRMDQNCKYYCTYSIEVQRIDVKDEDDPEDLHWTVERRYNEFYVLEAKLIEFHGELSIQLPTKRSQYHKGIQFLESRRLEFEKFLQTLLTLPSLQGSELLYKFLKSPVPFTSSFLPDIRLGKMIKTVPMKLIKEKGQHLLPFLQAFLASTEPAKPKPSKTDWKEINEFTPSKADEKVGNTIYGDNVAGLGLESTNSQGNGQGPRSVISIEGIYDYIFYIAFKVLGVSERFLQLLAACDILIHNTLQAYTEWYLDSKLQQVFKPQRLAELLNLLRDALFFDDDPPRTRRQKAERARQSLEQTKDFFPDLLVKILGQQKFEDGIALLFSILQYPLLNKQLSYVLLDIVTAELFPELQVTNVSPSPP